MVNSCRLPFWNANGPCCWKSDILVAVRKEDFLSCNSGHIHSEANGLSDSFAKFGYH